MFGTVCDVPAEAVETPLGCDWLAMLSWRLTGCWPGEMVDVRSSRFRVCWRCFKLRRVPRELAARQVLKVRDAERRNCGCGDVTGRVARPIDGWRTEAVGRSCERWAAVAPRGVVIPLRVASKGSKGTCSTQTGRRQVGWRPMAPPPMRSGGSLEGQSCWAWLQ